MAKKAKKAKKATAAKKAVKKTAKRPGPRGFKSPRKRETDQLDDL